MGRTYLICRQVLLAPILMNALVCEFLCLYGDPPHGSHSITFHGLSIYAEMYMTGKQPLPYSLGMTAKAEVRT